MVEAASNHSESVNVMIPSPINSGGQELRTSILETYDQREEPGRAYPAPDAPLRIMKTTKVTNLQLTQLAADLLSIISQGEKSVRNLEIIPAHPKSEKSQVADKFEFLLSLFRPRSFARCFSSCPTSPRTSSTRRLRTDKSFSCNAQSSSPWTAPSWSTRGTPARAASPTTAFSTAVSSSSSPVTCSQALLRQTLQRSSAPFLST